MIAQYKTASASTEEQHVTVTHTPNSDGSGGVTQWSCSGCNDTQEFTYAYNQAPGPAQFNAKQFGLKHAEKCRL